uniref:Proteoglycan Cow-like n=1 Tax=Crassostrea virginica TaxID=6565 RepID=A0A8B8CKE7_CRAVI|nr:proteoglycan Cow-like [Crassostrea virginica]
MDGKLVLCFLVICFAVLEANRHGFETKKRMWKKDINKNKDLKFKWFTRGNCVEECKKSEVCVKEKGTDKSVCLARHVVRDSRRLLRKSHRLGRKNFNHDKHGKFHKRHHFQRLSKNQKHGLEYYEKKALEFSKYQDKINILKHKHVRVAKQKKPVKPSKDRDILEKMEDAKVLMERTVPKAVKAPVCDKKDLDKMADRLQGWFVTLHEKHQEKIHPHISKRSVGERQTDGKCHCIKSVMWQFHQLDKNKDHHLDKVEMSEMENNQREACVKPFLHSCDKDADSRLSKQEWCCCYQADAPCDLAQKEAKEGKLLGATIPRCTPEGYFRRMQCNASTGFCWCADFNGNEIRGTRLSMKKGEPSCEKFDALGRFKTP